MEVVRGEKGVLALLDEKLHVTLADTDLARQVGLGADLVGRRLTDGLPEEPKLRRRLRLLLDGVARRVPFRSPTGTPLVASRVSEDDGLAQRWIVVRGAPFEPGTVGMPAVVGDGASTLVGRGVAEDELEEFLLADDRSVLLLEGSVGVGKTALLEMFAKWCIRMGCPFVKIDARTELLRDRGALGEVAEVIARGSATSPLRRLALLASDQRWVLLIDNLDVTDTAGDGSYGPGIFDGLPPSCRIVGASRARGRAIAMISASRPVRTHRVTLLSDLEALELASTLGLGPERRSEVLLTHGHPGAIHAVAQASSVETSEIDRMLMTSELPITRVDLKTSALVPRLNEYVLASLLGEPEAARVYDAMKILCFPDRDGLGLRMPHMYRRAYQELLRRRDPRRITALRERLVRHYLGGIARAEPDDRSWMSADLVEMLLESGCLGTDFDDRRGQYSVRLLEADEGAAVDAFCRAFAPLDQENIRARLRGGVPTFAVHASAALDDDGPIHGIAQLVTVERGCTAGTKDPALAALPLVLRESGANSDDPACVLLAFESAPSDGVKGVLRLRLLEQIVRQAGGGTTTLVCGTSETILPPRYFTEVGANRHSYLVCDFRKHPIAEILVGFLRPHRREGRRPSSRLPRASVSVEEVRLALAHLDQWLVLRSSPLSAVAASSGHASVRELLVSAVDALKTEDSIGHSILVAVYLEKRGKHESIAAELGIPYSTFRRRHAAAVEGAARIVEATATAPRALD